MVYCEKTATAKHMDFSDKTDEDREIALKMVRKNIDGKGHFNHVAACKSLIIHPTSEGNGRRNAKLGRLR